MPSHTSNLFFSISSGYFAFIRPSAFPSTASMWSKRTICSCAPWLFTQRTLTSMGVRLLRVRPFYALSSASRTVQPSFSIVPIHALCRGTSVVCAWKRRVGGCKVSVFMKTGIINVTATSHGRGVPGVTQWGTLWALSSLCFIPCPVPTS